MKHELAIQSTVARFFRVVVISVTAASGLSADDWPTYRHDQRRSGVSGDPVDVRYLSDGWTLDAASAPQPAWAGPAKWDAYAGIRGLRSMRNYDPVFHPIIANGMVYYGSSVDDTVRCVELRTGKTAWTFTTDGPVRIAPTYHEGRLYFGSDDGFAYCVDGETGVLAWRFRPDTKAQFLVNNGRYIPGLPSRSGVLLDHQTAYFSFGMLPWHPCYFCAVDAKTGSSQGKGRYVRKHTGLTTEGAMLVAAGRIFVPQGRVAPLMVRQSDGSVLGQLEGGGGSFALLTGDALVHGPGNKTGWLTESSAKDYTKIATYKAATAIVIAGARAFMLTPNGVLATDRKRRKTLWKYDCKNPLELILAKSTLLVGMEDSVHCFDSTTGRLIRRIPVRGRAYGLAASEGHLVVSTDEGIVYCFAPSEHRVDERAELDRVEKNSAPRDLPEKTPGLLGHWVFRKDLVDKSTVIDLAGNHHATTKGNQQIQEVYGHSCLKLDGHSTHVQVTDKIGQAALPAKAMTVEAWVRIDSPTEWGGIVGCIQDNGDYERGWLLGYRKQQFCFALATEAGTGRLTYMTAAGDFQLKRWYHVAATYDGSTMRLYIDGQLAKKSADEKGPIAYPPQAVYEIGAYRDKDEFFPLSGMIHEVRVSDQLASHEQIRKSSRLKIFSAAAGKAELVSGPFLQFTGPRTARVSWQTETPSPTELTYELPPFTRTIRQGTDRTHHEVELTDLKRNRLYQYRIAVQTEQGKLRTPDFECDTFFNFRTYDSPAGAVVASDSVVPLPRGNQRGIAVSLGHDPALTAQLIAQTSYRVVVFSVDPKVTAQLRATFLGSRLYGNRITAHTVSDWQSLPVTPASANLVVCPDPKQPPGQIDQAFKMARPHGGVVLVRRASASSAVDEQLRAWDTRKLGPMDARREGDWVYLRRGDLPGAGSWSHIYGEANNSAYGGESLGQARNVDQLQVQWVGRPGPRAQPDRNGRKPPPLSTGGRLFVQGLHRIIALDSYNGTVLWAWELPDLGRFNMPRDCGNWCADESHLYVAIRDRCWILDAATGAVGKSLAVAKPAEGHEYDWGYLAQTEKLVIGSAVRKGSSYTNFWGGSAAGWYDATGGPATFKVASDNLYAIDKTSQQPHWVRSEGVVLNSTITIDRRTLYFVECRSPEVIAGSQRRLAPQHGLDNLFLVSLDAATGKLIWEEKLGRIDGEVALYLACSNDRICMVASGSKHYTVSVFKSADASQLWTDRFAWGSDNHGGHMSRPAMVGDLLVVRPRVYKLSTGELQQASMPGGGCGTYSATTGAFVFRAGNVTMWDPAGGSSSWNRLRPDCWLSTIPAGGMLLSPEGGGGCSCGSWMETSIGFIPRRYFE